MDKDRSADAAAWSERNQATIQVLTDSLVDTYVQQDFSLKNTLAILGISFYGFRLARMHVPEIRRLWASAQDMQIDELKADMWKHWRGTSKKDRAQVSSAAILMNNHYLMNKHTGSFEDLPPNIKRMLVPRPLRGPQRESNIKGLGDQRPIRYIMLTGEGKVRQGVDSAGEIAPTPPTPTPKARVPSPKLIYCGGGWGPSILGLLLIIFFSFRIAFRSSTFTGG